jgi:hypothetical protein
MIPVDLAAAGLVLVGTVGLGMLAHELSHAVTLRLLGVPCEFRWLPGRAGADARARLSGTAAVVPREVESEMANRLRVAAVMPFLLATPVVLVPLGVLPDPFVTGEVVQQVAVVGWLACAIPSPQDFSLLWHAERAIAGSDDPR